MIFCHIVTLAIIGSVLVSLGLPGRHERIVSNDIIKLQNVPTPDFLSNGSLYEAAGRSGLYLRNFASDNKRAKKTRPPSRLADMDEMNIKFSINCFKVPDLWVQANVSFTIVYQFEIGDDSHPRNVVAIQDKYLDQARVSSCIKNWKFIGLGTDSKHILLLNWEHGIGWITMLIYSDQFSFLIRLRPEYD